MVFLAYDFLGFCLIIPKICPGNIAVQIALALQGFIPVNMPAQQLYSGLNNINIGLRFRLHKNYPDTSSKKRKKLFWHRGYQYKAGASTPEAGLASGKSINMPDLGRCPGLNTSNTAILSSWRTRSPVSA